MEGGGMAGDQLSGLDTAFLCLESADAPMHLGALAVFDGRAAVPPGRLVTLLGERAARLSRLRRRVVPLRTATGGDVWQADPRFDVRRHVQLHRLDGADQPSLAEVAARLMAEPLDVAHPLWQVHVLTGLADDRFAVLVKMHHAVADGLRAVEIGLGLLDGYTDLVAARTMPEAVDRSVLGTVRSAVRFAAHPDRLLGRVARTAAGLPGAMREVGGIAASVLSNVRLRTDRSPLTAGARLSVPAGRRLALLRLDGSELRQVRRVHGGTDNDILLAVLAGALRDWVSQRGQPAEDVRLRVLVPVR